MCIYKCYHYYYHYYYYYHCYFYDRAQGYDAVIEITEKAVPDRQQGGSMADHESELSQHILGFWGF